MCPGFRMQILSYNQHSRRETSIQDMDGYTNNDGDFAVILGLLWDMQPLEHWNAAFSRSTREFLRHHKYKLSFPKTLRAKTFTFFGRLHHEAFHMPITFSKGVIWVLYKTTCTIFFSSSPLFEHRGKATSKNL